MTIPFLPRLEALVTRYPAEVAERREYLSLLRWQIATGHPLDDLRTVPGSNTFSKSERLMSTLAHINAVLLCVANDLRGCVSGSRTERSLASLTSRRVRRWFAQSEALHVSWSMDRLYSAKNAHTNVQGGGAVGGVFGFKRYFIHK